MLDTHTLRVTWRDGETSAGWTTSRGKPRARHTYTEPEEYTLKVTVSDDDGGQRSRTGTVVVLAADAASPPDELPSPPQVEGDSPPSVE